MKKKDILRLLNVSILMLLPIFAYSQIKYVDLSISQQDWQDCLTSIVENKQYELFQVFPNPSINGEITLKMQYEFNENPVLITIYNIYGIKVYCKEYKPQQLLFQSNINLREFSSGIYLIVAASGDIVNKTKILLLDY